MESDEAKRLFISNGVLAVSVTHLTTMLARRLRTMTDS